MAEANIARRVPVGNPPKIFSQEPSIAAPISTYQRVESPARVNEGAPAMADGTSLVGPDTGREIPDVFKYLEKAETVQDYYFAWTTFRGLAVIEGDGLTAIATAEDEALFGMIRSRAEAMFEVRMKLEVYRNLIDDSVAGDWSDGRDALMLESIELDLVSDSPILKASAN